MFRLAFQILMNFTVWLFGSNLNFFLISELFKTDPKKQATQIRNQIDPALKQIKKRKIAKFNRCNFCIRDKRNKLFTKYGSDSIERELDIVRFIRRQKMFDIVFRQLFTRVERYLIRN